MTLMNISLQCSIKMTYFSYVDSCQKFSELLDNGIKLKLSKVPTGWNTDSPCLCTQALPKYEAEIRLRRRETERETETGGLRQGDRQGRGQDRDRQTRGGSQRQAERGRQVQRERVRQRQAD